MSDEANEAAIAAKEIAQWLDVPQQHLNNETRRKALEGMLIVHFSRLRRVAERKERTAHWMFYVGILGTAMTLFLNYGKIVEMLWP